MQRKTKLLIMGSILGVIVIGVSSYFVVKYMNQKGFANPYENLVNQEQELGEYIVISDNTKLRQTSMPDSIEVAILKMGDKVTVIKRSDQRTTYSNTEDYWYNAKYGDKLGWIFGDYITTKDKLDEKILTKYEKFLFGLSQEDVNSVARAVSSYKSYDILTTSTSVNDAMFRKFKDFYKKMLSNLDQRFLKEVYFNAAEVTLLNNLLESEVSFTSLNKTDNISDKQLKDKVVLLLQNGFSLVAGVDFYYIEENGDFEVASFYGQVSDGIKDFLSIRSKELREGLMRKGELIITYDQLGERISSWDGYIKKYSGYNETRDAKDLIDKYLSLYLIGTATSSTFDAGSGVLKDNVRESYEKFIQQYKTSDYYSTVKDYYEILKKTNFENSSEARDFLKGKGIFAIPF